MTHQTIILQVQGGMGNQMIQYGYLQSVLSQRKGCKAIINPIMVGKTWSQLRGVSHRPLSKLLLTHFPILESKREQISDWISSKLLPKGHVQLSDDQQSFSNSASVIHCSGYFQTRQAFEDASQPLWRSILNAIELESQGNSHVYSIGRVALHHRLGDYLWKENQRLFANISLKERVKTALNWRDSLGGKERIAVFTDSPQLLQEQMNAELSAGESSECKISANSSSLVDFNQMSRHRHVVAGCSTFSLCAGRIAWERLSSSGQHQDQPTLQLPLRWYQDEEKNDSMMAEMNNCSFTRL